MISTENTPRDGAQEEDGIQEPQPPAYSVEPSWVDTAGRTRTWALKDPHGTQVAVITTKGAAVKLAALLNGKTERDPAC